MEMVTIMTAPVQITYRTFPPSEAIEARVHERAARLLRIQPRITGIHVVVEATNRHGRKGHLFHVRIDATMPRGEVVINREAHDKRAHEDVYVAIRDAFNAAERRLKATVERKRGQKKHHEAPPHGRVLAKHDNYGFLRTADGQELYFHRNAVTDDAFDLLAVGEEVRFVEADDDAEKGPQASAVTRIGKHHIVTP
jgi:ribosomal subunit interface protein